MNGEGSKGRGQIQATLVGAWHLALGISRLETSPETRRSSPVERPERQTGRAFFRFPRFLESHVRVFSAVVIDLSFHARIYNGAPDLP